MAPRAVVRIGTTTALIQGNQQISGIAQKIEFREPPLIRPIEFRERPDFQMKGNQPGV